MPMDQVVKDNPVEVRFPWENLIRLIDSGKVIPIIGPELYTFHNNLLYQELGSAISTPKTTHLYARDKHFFHKVASEKLKPSEPGTNGTSYSALKDDIKEFLEAKKPTPSKYLLQLARISRFRIFINMTYDDLLSEALIEVGRDVEKLNYTPKEKYLEDINNYDRSLKSNPNLVIVFNVLGGLENNTPSFTESDIIESVSTMHADILANNNRFFNKIKSSDLLFIGCNYKNWLMRFFVRSISNSAFDPRISEQKKFFSSCLSTDLDDMDLMFFLEHHSFKTDYPDMQVFFQGSTETFSEKFWNKVKDKEWVIPEANFRSSVFVSFHGGDRDTAGKINDYLLGKGIKTWFDSKGDRVGSNVQKTIRSAIRHANIFLVIISEQYLQLGYVERELNWVTAINDDLPEAEQIKIIALRIGPIDKTKVPIAAKENFWAEIDEFNLEKKEVLDVMENLSAKLVGL